MSKLTQPSIDHRALGETFSTINDQSLNLFTDAFTRWVTNCNETSSELLRFVNERFDKDLKLAARFAECKRPEDFLALQTQLVTTMIADYAQEATKLAGMLTASSDEIARASLMTS